MSFNGYLVFKMTEKHLNGIKKDWINHWFIPEIQIYKSWFPKHLYWRKIKLHNMSVIILKAFKEFFVKSQVKLVIVNFSNIYIYTLSTNLCLWLGEYIPAGEVLLNEYFPHKFSTNVVIFLSSKFICSVFLEYTLRKIPRNITKPANTYCTVKGLLKAKNDMTIVTAFLHVVTVTAIKAP